METQSSYLSMGITRTIRDSSSFSVHINHFFKLWSCFCEDKYIFIQYLCVSAGCALYFWDWSVLRILKNLSFEERFYMIASVAAWVMEKMLRETIWEGNSAVEEFSTSIFTPLGKSGCYGIADGHRCHAGVSVRAELRRRSMLEWLTSSELYWPTSERTHTRTRTEPVETRSEAEKGRKKKESENV